MKTGHYQGQQSENYTKINHEETKWGGQEKGGEKVGRASESGCQLKTRQRNDLHLIVIRSH